MKRSMRMRLTIIFSGMLIFTIVCMCLVNVFLLPDFYQRSKVRQMQSVYAETVSTCQNIAWKQLTDTEKNEVYDQLDTLSGNANVEIYILQVEVYSQSGEIAALDYVYPANSNRLQEVTREKVGKYVKLMYFGVELDENCELLSKSNEYELYKVYDKQDDSNYIELTGVMPEDYWVYVRANYQSIQESVRVSNQFIMYTGLIIVVIGIFIMLLISNQYTKPILQLAKHARNMQNLNFSSHYEVNRDDEIGVLAGSMNSLAEELERTISELKTANNELQLDLERRSEQEDMRREFLANVSHELKTPIALIQGYAEGLQENINDDPESREFYCEVIIDEADKMNKMVKKLLNLNQLEFGNGQVHLEHFDLMSVLNSVVSASEILFRQKEVTLSYQQSEEAVMVWADEYMIEEVVTNYISNALNHVKYENKVELKTELEDGLVRVSVFNTGDPIPDEDLEKIWTKFYKVDKARTRQYGGNGIGLSIVKAIMEAHNQQYGVKNYDNGVEFWFELDVNNSIKCKNTSDNKTVD